MPVIQFFAQHASAIQALAALVATVAVVAGFFQVRQARIALEAQIAADTVSNGRDVYSLALEYPEVASSIFSNVSNDASEVADNIQAQFFVRSVLAVFFEIFEYHRRGVSSKQSWEAAKSDLCRLMAYGNFRAIVEADIALGAYPDLVVDAISQCVEDYNAASN
jgi:hypothetical protein